MKIDLEQFKLELKERRNRSEHFPHASDFGLEAPEINYESIWYHQGIIDGIDYALFVLHHAEFKAKNRWYKKFGRRIRLHWILFKIRLDLFHD